MSTNPADSKGPPAGGLQGMLARLRGLMQGTSGVPAAPPPSSQPAMMAPETLQLEPMHSDERMPADIAVPPTHEYPVLPRSGSPSPPTLEHPILKQSANPVCPPTLEQPILKTPEGLTPPTVEQPVLGQPIEGEMASTIEQTGLLVCPACYALRKPEDTYCAECGWIFGEDAEAESPAPAEPAPLIKGRYQLLNVLDKRGDVERFKALDHGVEAATPREVILLRGPVEPTLPATKVDLQIPDGVNALPTMAEISVAEPVHASWPTVGWERNILERLVHPVFPHCLDSFQEGNIDYLVEEIPIGQSLWDAWDDSTRDADQRFSWLKQIAEGLFQLHRQDAILEGLRPDIVVIAPDGTPRLTDISDLLPLPLPVNAPIRARLYTAPELVLQADPIDARSDLYSFGATLYALYLGRELTEMDFEMQGVPKTLFERFPEMHPLLARIIGKTFCRDPERRFPTDEASQLDATGFVELVRGLEDCRRCLDQVRFEIAAWSTTGMIRSGNEDALAILHAIETRENDLGDCALILLADGMGGYEAGEVAAAMAITTMREHLTRLPVFQAFAGGPAACSSFDLPPSTPLVDVPACRKAILNSLREANQQVLDAALESHRPMGCTAEVVYLAGKYLLVGHVGDSRVYHQHQGKLAQVSRDQTWVHRMVDLGLFTPEDAANHPRRGELQQAIGGHGEIEPDFYEAHLKPGDWVLVCSDGVTNHLDDATIQKILQSSPSAEWAARRLVNRVNLEGATDNATVAVVRIS